MPTTQDHVPDNEREEPGEGRQTLPEAGEDMPGWAEDWVEAAVDMSGWAWAFSLLAALVVFDLIGIVGFHFVFALFGALAFLIAAPMAAQKLQKTAEGEEEEEEAREAIREFSRMMFLGGLIGSVVGSYVNSPIIGFFVGAFGCYGVTARKFDRKANPDRYQLTPLKVIGWVFLALVIWHVVLPIVGVASCLGLLGAALQSEGEPSPGPSTAITGDAVPPATPSPNSREASRRGIIEEWEARCVVALTDHRNASIFLVAMQDADPALRQRAHDQFAEKGDALFSVVETATEFAASLPDNMEFQTDEVPCISGTHELWREVEASMAKLRSSIRGPR